MSMTHVLIVVFSRSSFPTREKCRNVFKKEKNDKVNMVTCEGIIIRRVRSHGLGF